MSKRNKRTTILYHTQLMFVVLFASVHLAPSWRTQKETRWNMTCLSLFITLAKGHATSNKGRQKAVAEFWLHMLNLTRILGDPVQRFEAWKPQNIVSYVPWWSLNEVSLSGSLKTIWVESLNHAYLEVYLTFSGLPENMCSSTSSLTPVPAYMWLDKLNVRRGLAWKIVIKWEITCQSQGKKLNIKSTAIFDGDSIAPFQRREWGDCWDAAHMRRLVHHLYGLALSAGASCGRKSFHFRSN